MKICWDNLEYLKYVRKSGIFTNVKNCCKYVYVDECKNCKEPFLAQIYYKNGMRSITTYCSNTCRGACFTPTRLPESQHLSHEIWKPIRFFKGYCVSNLGRVSGKYGNILRPGIVKGGYSQVVLHKNNKRKSVFIHTLVMNAFIGPIPFNMEVDHKNSNPKDNRLSNLQYVTPKENVQKSRVTKLTIDDVILIRKDFDNKMKRIDIAKKFNINLRHVYHVGQRKVWGNIKEEGQCYDIERLATRAFG